jgi:hypothetical protein
MIYSELWGRLKSTDLLVEGQFLTLKTYEREKDEQGAAATACDKPISVDVGT